MTFPYFTPVATRPLYRFYRLEWITPEQWSLSYHTGQACYRVTVTKRRSNVQWSYHYICYLHLLSTIFL